MAGSREPVALVLAKGKKHFSEAEILERKRTEVQAPKAKKVKIPSYLAECLHKKFKATAKALIDLNIMSDIDFDSLARYLMAENTYLVLTKRMFKILNADDIAENTQLEMMEQVSAMQDRYFKQCRAAAQDLGLTISSRCKLVIPKDAPPAEDADSDLFA